MDSVFLTVLNMSINGCYVIPVVLLARLLLKKAPKIFSYALWFVVLFRLLCPIALTSSFGILPANQLALIENIFFDDTTAANNSTSVTAAYTGTDPAVTADTSVAGKDSGVITGQPDSSLNEVGKAAAGTASEINASQGAQLIQEPDITPSAVGENMPEQASASNKILQIAEIVWLVGMAVLAGYSIWSFLKIKRSLKGAEHAGENIYEKEGLGTPFVFGLIKPRIYLPSGLVGEERAFILAHEKMHIRRFDHIVKLIAFLALILHWLNPFVWTAFILMTKDMEMSCDEAVIRKMGMKIKKEYSVSLLNMATGKNSPAGTPLAFGEGNVKGRIRNVLRYKKAGMGIIVLCVAVVAAVSIFLATDTNRAEVSNRIKVTGEEKNQVYSQSTVQSEDDAAFPDKVMDRLIETIGTDNALPFDNTADILPDKDALIKLCVSQDGKYEAYGCISPEYGFRGIILNNIIDGEANYNYFYDTWNCTDRQPELITMDQTQHRVAFIEPWYENKASANHIRYFTGHDSGALTEMDKPEALLPEEDIFKISVTNGSTGEQKEYSRLDSSTGFSDLLSKYEGMMLELSGNSSGNNVDRATGYQYALRFYDYNDILLQTIYLQGNKTDIADDAIYQEAGLGSIGELYLVADSLFQAAAPEIVFLSQIGLKTTQEIPGVQMSVTYSTDCTANVVFTNTSEDELFYNDWYSIEKKTDGQWQAAGLAGDNLVFHDIAYNLPPGGTGIWSVNWSNTFGQLPAGEYRIVKSIDNPAVSYPDNGNAFAYMGAEFTVE